MEYEIVAFKEAMEFEVVDVEKAENGSDSFAVQSTLEAAPTDDNCVNEDNILSSRINNEHNYVKTWIKHEVKDEEVFETQAENIKLEKDLDSEHFEVVEEFIVKKGDDSDTFLEENSEIVLDRISGEYAEAKEEPEFNATDIEISMDMKKCPDIEISQYNPGILLESTAEHKILRSHHHICKEANRKSFSCYNCDYIACCKYILIKHMEVHSQGIDKYISSKHSLDNHTIGKHNVPIPPVSYQTVGFKIINKCIYCNATYTRKWGLNNHIVKKHPDSVASLTFKVHECTHCTFKTTRKDHLARHMFKHPEVAGSGCKPKICIHCNAKYTRKVALDDHIIKKHPDFIASVSCKIHECKHCPFKTTLKNGVLEHMLKHPETASLYEFCKCEHCDGTFKTKITLNNHIIRKHPEFIASITCKIHECIYCMYKTPMKNHLAKHMSSHPEAAGSYKLNKCVHCNATLKTKQSLDDHIVKKHPHSLESVFSHILECTHCTYKTVRKSVFSKHMLKHSAKSGSSTLSILVCKHCNAKFEKQVLLDDHVTKIHAVSQHQFQNKILKSWKKLIS